jgi:hypothetical protein
LVKAGPHIPVTFGQDPGAHDVLYRRIGHLPGPAGNRTLKVALPPFNALAFSTLPGWARRMYGRSGGPLTDIAATAGLRAARLAFGQQRLFLAAMRAVHRAEWAGEKRSRGEPGRAR